MKNCLLDLMTINMQTLNRVGINSPYSCIEEVTSMYQVLIVNIKELLAQTPHHIAWLLAQHIYPILFTDMRYHMKKLMTYSVDDAAIRFTFPDGKHTPSFS